MRIWQSQGITLNAVVLSDEKNVSQAEFVIHVLRDQGEKMCVGYFSLLPQ